VGRGVVLQRMWVLKGVIAPKPEKVAGRQKTMCDEEIHNWYSSPSYKEGQIKMIQMGK